MEIGVDWVPVEVDVWRPLAGGDGGIVPGLGVDGCGANVFLGEAQKALVRLAGGMVF